MKLHIFKPDGSYECRNWDPQERPFYDANAFEEKTWVIYVNESMGRWEWAQACRVYYKLFWSTYEEAPTEYRLKAMLLN